MSCVLVESSRIFQRNKLIDSKTCDKDASCRDISTMSASTSCSNINTLFSVPSSSPLRAATMHFNQLGSLDTLSSNSPTTPGSDDFQFSSSSDCNPPLLPIQPPQFHWDRSNPTSVSFSPCR